MVGVSEGENGLEVISCIAATAVVRLSNWVPSRVTSFVVFVVFVVSLDRSHLWHQSVIEKAGDYRGHGFETQRSGAATFFGGRRW